MKKIPNLLSILSNDVSPPPNDSSLYEDVSSPHTNYIRNKIGISTLDIKKIIIKNENTKNQLPITIHTINTNHLSHLLKR